MQTNHSAASMDYTNSMFPLPQQFDTTWPISFSVNTVDGREIISLLDDDDEKSFELANVDAVHSIPPQDSFIANQNSANLLHLGVRDPIPHQTVSASNESQKAIGSQTLSSQPTNLERRKRKSTAQNDQPPAKKPAVRRSRKRLLNSSDGLPLVCEPGSPATNNAGSQWPESVDYNLFQHEIEVFQEVQWLEPRCQTTEDQDDEIQCLDDQIQEIKAQLAFLEHQKQKTMLKAIERERQCILQDLAVPVSVLRALGLDGSNFTNPQGFEEDLSLPMLKRTAQVKSNFALQMPPTVQFRRIDRIEYIINDTLYKNFNRTKKIFEILGKSTEEILLFHGSAPKNIDK